VVTFGLVSGSFSGKPCSLFPNGQVQAVRIKKELRKIIRNIFFIGFPNRN